MKEEAPDISWAGAFGSVVVDLDGVLARETWPERGVIGDPIPAGVELVRRYAAQGYSIVIHTSRPESDRDAIWGWVLEHDVPVDRVVCEKPVAALYVDDRAWRPWWCHAPLDRTALTAEQHDVLDEFRRLLMGPTLDGGRKRAAGGKPPWRQDDGHREAMQRHLRRWEQGERRDPDSGSHPLVHVAWRALAIAWQETHGEP